MPRFDRPVSRRDLLKGAGLAGLAAALGSSLPPLAREAGAQEAAAGAVAPKVPRRALGRTGRTVPILNFGAVRMDPNFDPKLAEALRHGVDYLDTAEGYHNGANEQAIGNHLAKAGCRKDVWITTKAEVPADVAGLRRSLEGSLKRLQTDYVDAFFLHGIDKVELLSEEAWRVVEQLKKEGKTRFFGFSSCFPASAQLLERAAKVGWVDLAMIGYNFQMLGPQNPETGEFLKLEGAEKEAYDKAAATWGDEMRRALDAAHKAGIGLIAMKTQRSSLSFAERTVKWEDQKYTKGQAVLKAVWEDERIASICSSMRSLETLRENIAAALDRQQLGAAQWRALERYARDMRGAVCDRCDHICGAHLPAGLQVGSVLRCLTYHETYGDPEKARWEFHALPAGARRCDGVDFAAASAACPNGVDIGRWMRRANDLLA